MSLTITDQCIACNACKLVCPKHAIRITEQQFSISSHRCNECKTHFEQPQCASICPVENAITDEQGIALNPTLSLAPLPAILELILEQQGAS